MPGFSDTVYMPCVYCHHCRQDNFPDQSWQKYLLRSSNNSTSTVTGYWHWLGRSHWKTDLQRYSDVTQNCPSVTPIAAHRAVQARQPQRHTPRSTLPRSHSVDINKLQRSTHNSYSCMFKTTLSPAHPASWHPVPLPSNIEINHEHR